MTGHQRSAPAALRQGEASTISRTTLAPTRLGPAFLGPSSLNGICPPHPLPEACCVTCPSLHRLVLRPRLRTSDTVANEAASGSAGASVPHQLWHSMLLCAYRSVPTPHFAAYMAILGSVAWRRVTKRICSASLRALRGMFVQLEGAATGARTHQSCRAASSRTRSCRACSDSGFHRTLAGQLHLHTSPRAAVG